MYPSTRGMGFDWSVFGNIVQSGVQAASSIWGSPQSGNVVPSYPAGYPNTYPTGGTVPVNQAGFLGGDMSNLLTIGLILGGGYLLFKGFKRRR
jgi:hypothetical protein